MRFVGFSANAVLRSSDGAPLRVRLTLDGQALPAESAGRDVTIDAAAGAAVCVVTEGRLYELVAGSLPGPQTLRLYPERPGLEVYTFTFGGCAAP